MKLLFEQSGRARESELDMPVTVELDSGCVVISVCEAGEDVAVAMFGLEDFDEIVQFVNDRREDDEDDDE